MLDSLILFVIFLIVLSQIQAKHPSWPPFKGGNPGKSSFEGGFRGMSMSLIEINIKLVLNLTKLDTE